MIRSSYKHLAISLSFIALSLFLVFNLNTNDIDLGKQGAQVGGSLNDGLIAHYSFDEGSGATITDSSGGSNNAKVYNGDNTFWRDSFSGKGYFFNGSNTHISVVASSQADYPFEFNGGEFSFFTWIRPDSNDLDGGWIFSKSWNSSGNYNYGFSYGADRKLKLTVSLWGKYQSSLESRSSINNGSWSHVGFVIRSDNRIEIYINGVLEKVGDYTALDSNTYDGRENNHTAPIFGSIYPYGEGWAGKTPYSINATLDEIRIYKRALSEIEVSTLSSQVRPFSFEPLVPNQYRINEQEEINLVLKVNNSTGLDLVYEAINLPVGASFDIAKLKFYWKPNSDQAGEHNILFRVSHGGNYDEVNLSIIVKDVTVDFGCQNSALSSCLDFSKFDQGSGFEFSQNTMTELESENGISYRSAKGSLRSTFKLPAFSVYPNGIPNVPLVLDIFYKDTIHSDASNNQFGRAQLWGFIGGSISLYHLGYLGGNNDGYWKHYQYYLQPTEFPLVKVENGKFILHLDVPGDMNTRLPISYISIKAISFDTYNAWNSQMTKQYGFTEIPIPNDQPATPIDYQDSQITVFSRDIMDLVYKTTKPALAEIDRPVGGFSLWGEIEPMSFSIFSKTGIDGIKIKVSDLSQNNSVDIIPSASIEVNQVVQSNVQLIPPKQTLKTYTLFPSWIAPFDQISILPDSTKQFWLKVHVPPRIAGGVYKGEIVISRSDRILKKLPVNFEVLPLNLDLPKQINFSYRLPELSGKSGEVVRIFKEAHLESAIEDKRNVNIVSANGKIIDFDTVGFEADLNRYYSEGIIRDRVIISESLWETIYKNVYGRGTNGDPDLYDRLTNPLFQEPYGLLIKKITDVAEKKNIEPIFWVVDEPAEPYRRIICDRLYTIIKQVPGTKTLVTYQTPMSLSMGSPFYKVPGNSIKPLDSLLDHPVSIITQQGDSFRRGIKGYYTTYVAHLKNPAYNRFLHGIFAYRTGADVIFPFTFDGWIADPYNDFDAGAPNYYPDFVFVYPTWEGSLRLAMSFEGIREGIKDARYFGMLERLISQSPSSPLAQEARRYIEGIKNRVSPDFRADYFDKMTPYGFSGEIFKNISANGNPKDFTAFNDIRYEIFKYIKKISGIVTPTPDPSVPTPTPTPTPPGATPTPNPNPTPTPTPTPPPPPGGTNGLCGTTLNSCRAGSYSDTEDTSTKYNWSCLGLNRGYTASCSQNKYIPPPSNRPPGQISTKINYQAPTINIPTTTVDVSMPELPSWLDFITAFILDIANNIIRGVKRTGEMVGI